MNQLPTYDRINIGCGHDKLPGYLNVDMDPACKPDLLLKNNDYSVLPKRHFAEVLAHDVLEHIPRAYTMMALLEWADLLKLGGLITIQTSSILGVARLLERHARFVEQHNFTIYLFGNQAHPGDFHHTGFTEATLRTYMLSAGFEISSFVERDQWLFFLEAKRTLDWTALLDTHASASNEDFLEAAYQAALGRPPQEPFRSQHLRELGDDQSRRLLLRSLFAALERNYNVAFRYGI